MSWKNCKNILCIRPDNMGDLIMSAPAIRALKQTFGARITIFTSSMAKGVIKLIPEIDDAIIFDLPWVKTAETSDANSFIEVVETIKDRNFDAAVIFTVFSQNPLPTAMVAYLAGIPRVLGYCRENPYYLLTDWVPDKEPYDYIKHQVRRDLDLVATVGAITDNENLHLTVDENLLDIVRLKLSDSGIDPNRLWLILHPCVSEKKRKYPIELWAEAGKNLINKGYQLLLTGSAAEKNLTDELQNKIGPGSFSIAGLFKLDEFICLIKHAPLLISVNTGTTHIAAAVGTKVIVLYAQTNPQHTPWNVPNRVLEFPVETNLRSKNEVITYLNKTIYNAPAKMPNADDVVNAVNELLSLPNSSGQLFREIPNGNPVIQSS
jgi:lipopolysaccharide heptosyltransferase II